MASDRLQNITSLKSDANIINLQIVNEPVKNSPQKQ